MSVTWLHISDLHLKADEAYDRNVVLSALVRSVRGFREREGRAPDLIFATGDIAHSGLLKEYEVATRFFDQLLDAADLRRSRLYVIPGNHDVERKLGAGLARTLKSRSEADDYFDPNLPKPHLTQKLRSFSSWHDAYFTGIRNMPKDSTCGPLELVSVGGHRLAIFPINTALFCQDDSDHEKLFVGRRCFDAAVSELKEIKASLRIAMMHHPVEFLSGFERSHIRAGLVDELDVILTGHLHETDISDVRIGSGRNLYCAAGATYQTRDWANAAYYATFSGNDVRVFPIFYVDQPREVWTLDTSQFPYASKYEGRFPVPRDLDFRSFLPPGSGLRRGHHPGSVTPISLGTRVEQAGGPISLFADSGATLSKKTKIGHKANAKLAGQRKKPEKSKRKHSIE